MINPLISVIVPFFNAEKFIEETILSVINQTYTNWELILVDDGSSDRSQSKAEKFLKDKRICLLNRSNLPKGVSRCRNIGIENSGGSLLIFLDADDVLAPNCLEDRVKRIEKITVFDFVVFKMEKFLKIPGDLSVVSNQYPETGQTFLKLFLQGYNPWQTPCPIWNINFIKKLGGWDEDLKRITDPDMHSRALMFEGVQFEVVQDSAPDCYYRQKINPGAHDQEWLEQSITGRIYYFKKMFSLLSSKYTDSNQRNIYLDHMSLGIKSFITSWMLSRSRQFEQELDDFMEWIDQEDLLGKNKFRLIRLLSYLWRNDSLFTRAIHLKGFLTRFI